MQTQHEPQLPAQVQAARADLEEMRKAFGLGDTADDATARKAGADTGEQPTRKDEAKPHENWEAKFHTLQGKYNAEVPRLNEAVRQQQAEIQRLTALVEAKQQEQPAPKQQQPSINRDALEEYDPEFGKVADLIEAQKAQIEALSSELGRLQGNVQQVGQAQQMTAEQSFWRDLRSAVPDFDEVNADPAFHAWLAEEDGFSGMTRKEAGDRALANLDDVKVAKIINQFKSQRGQKRQRQQDVTPDTRTVSPDAHARQMQSPGATYSRDEIGEFYRKLQNGFPFKWRDQIVQNDAAASLIRIEIQQAGIEGRIA